MQASHLDLHSVPKNIAIKCEEKQKTTLEGMLHQYCNICLCQNKFFRYCRWQDHSARMVMVPIQLSATLKFWVCTFSGTVTKCPLQAIIYDS